MAKKNFVTELSKGVSPRTSETKKFDYRKDLTAKSVQPMNTIRRAREIKSVRPSEITMVEEFQSHVENRKGKK